MPLFQYRAIDGAGDVIDGQMEARTSAAVIERLQELGHLPLDAREISGQQGAGLRLFRRRGVRDRDITLVTRELAMLLSAGLPLEQALEVLSKDAGRAELAALVGTILEEVRGGQSLSTALEARGRAFSRLYINMVRAGEASGTLEIVLERLADFRERSERLRETVASALLYPAFLVTASVLSIILLMTYVVPQFEQTFANAGAALPTSTAIVIATGKWMQSYGWLAVAVVVIAGVTSRSLLTLPGPRRRWDALLLRLPLVRDIVMASATSRFCRTLGTLVANGVDLPTALTLLRNVMTNQVIADAIEGLTFDVRQGRGLAEPLAEAGVLPALAVQMLRVGEETGKLEPMSFHIAEMYERKVETTIKRMLTILEPLLVVSVGVIIGAVIVSILTAIVSVNDIAF